MNGHYAIAIDGPSGAGKSTLARRAAAEFGFLYVDTGAIYRTVGLAAHRDGIDCHDEEAVSAILPQLDIRMGYNEAGEQRMYLNGEDVSSAIRAPEISICASDVSSLPAVRAFLLEMQRKTARENNVLMDGRDIEYRDYQDTHRQTAPLRRAEDAVLLDTSDIGLEESCELLYRTIREKLNIGK